MGGNKEVVDKFLKKMKDRKGILPTRLILETDGATEVIDEE